MANRIATWTQSVMRLLVNVFVCGGVLLYSALFDNAVLAAGFDHDATRFELRGFHEYVECEVCHVNGRFKGTPTDCFACHGGSSQIPGGGKTLNHMFTTNACADCHRPDAWDSITRFDHSQTQGTCVQCHNGTVQPGKPANHVVSSDQCDSCHNTINWTMARFDHAGITAACSSCHNNSTATGKPGNHVMTNAECDSCHTTRAWTPAGFDHSGITQPCSSCHNGTTATGKHQNHLQTMAECDTCHMTQAWTPANFDHGSVTGNCSSCHNGTTATGKNNGHFVTNRECDYCHVTTRWSPVTYMHQGAGYPGNHARQLDCNDCHQGNVEMNVWTFPAYQPDCAGCHANNFVMDSHKKVDSPTIRYTVSELRDCTGACHLYNDSTFSTVREFRTGEHRVGDGEF